MQHTIYNTPVVKSILHGLSMFFLKILGWKATGQLPDLKKYLIILAPHTSNWDLFYGIIIGFAIKMDTYFLAKKQLFRRPFGPIMKWLGGMPIDRSTSEHTVEHVIEQFNEKDKLVVAITPEGTRKKAHHWKTGFYNIAVGANLPIVLGFIDYTLKKGGAGPVIFPSGDVDKDILVIRQFYSKITGKYCSKTGPINIAPHQMVS